jgi:type II secretory pathway component GspD/PulD (secretin)
LGFDWFTLNTQDHPFDPNDPLAGLRRTDTIYDRGLAGSGIPSLPGIIRGGGFIPNLLVQLGTIQENLQIDLLVSALAQLTKIDVVNAPNVAVRSGHIASITAGEQVPYFTVNVSGNNQTVSTTFKDIDVNLTVLPTVLSRNRISLAVKLNVQNVTGLSQVESGGATTTNPIIANRGVTTTMDVQDGATVVLGGLITTRKIDVKEKVPLLGEIPFIDFLFSNRHTQDSHSNLLFIIRPKIIAPGTDQSQDTILPPDDEK